MLIRGDRRSGLYHRDDRRGCERRSQTPEPGSGMSFYVGLDLGQSNDYTALAVVEKTKAGETGDASFATDLHLRHLERYLLRTPYPEMVARVAALVEDPQLRSTHLDSFLGRRILEEPELLVDATGVGRPVMDLFIERGLRYKAITITGGNSVTSTGG